MTVLRSELLSGRTVALVGGSSWTLRDALTALGAEVAEEPPVDALVYDAREVFGTGGSAGLSAATDGVWEAISAQVASGLLQREGGAKVVLIAPVPAAGEFADAARAALENLARTLSVEWARFGVTVTAIAPGRATSEAELAELVCFLVSFAGDYFSGCRLDLGLIENS